MPTYILFLFHFSLIVLLSAGLSYFIMRWTYNPIRHKRLFDNFSGMITSGLNSGAIVLLTLGLAFVFNQISTTHQSAKLAVLNETDALRTLGRISLNIEPDIGVPLMAATRLYTQEVIEKEWPRLSQGKSVTMHQFSVSALPPLTAMSDIVYSPDNVAKLPSVTANQLGQLVTRIRENRLKRIDASTFTIGIRELILAIITLASSSALLSLSLLTKAPIQLFSNFALLLVTLTAIYLAFSSQNPFSGIDSLVDTPLREALDRLNNMQLTKNL
jgi:hypothetical protein